MSRSYRTARRVIFCLIAITLLLNGIPVMAKQRPIGHFIPIGGHSDTYAGFAQAGGGMQSVAMLAGYQPNFSAGNSLQFGASEAWNTPDPVPMSTAMPTPTLAPPATATATSIPAAAPFGTSASGEMLPIMPITIGAALLLFVSVLVAGRRRK